MRQRREIAQKGCLGTLGQGYLIRGLTELRCKYPHHWLKAAEEARGDILHISIQPCMLAGWPVKLRKPIGSETQVLAVEGAGLCCSDLSEGYGQSKVCATAFEEQQDLSWNQQLIYPLNSPAVNAQLLFLMNPIFTYILSSSLEG